MKKNILFLGLAAMSLFTVASCSSDDDLQAGMSIGAGDNVITLALNPGGSGMAVRGARPVTSSEAANNVDKVVVKLYRLVDSNYSLVSEVENGQTIYEQDVTWSNGTKTASIPLKHLAQGSYKLVARGYNSTPSTAVSFDEGTPSTTINWTATQSTGDIEEVFAGELDLTVDAEGKVTADPSKTLTMNRRVAGFLAYFKNIPTKVNEDVVKSVRVVASNKATKFDIIGGTVAGYTSSSASATVNGLDAPAVATQTVLCSFDMSSATNWAGGNPTDDFYAFTTDGNQVANTVLGGGFMVPFGKVSGVNTLRVELVGDGEAVLKTFNVKMPTSFAMEYDINMNHFYSIGKKEASEGTNGPDGEDNTDDDDDPANLGGEGEIILSLSDAWDVVNNMVID